MPWWNNVTTSGLVWLGQSHTVEQLDPSTAVTAGIEVDFSLEKYNLMTFRYYRKLDWLLGIIGGAMLLFYLILWAPCTFFNRKLHKIRNVQQLLLLNHAQEGDAVTEDTVTAANVPHAYWLSCPLVNFFSASTLAAARLVQAAEYELDIVRLIKKMKVT
jgi:hypothetical protein